MRDKSHVAAPEAIAAVRPRLRSDFATGAALADHHGHVAGFVVHMIDPSTGDTRDRCAGAVADLGLSTAGMFQGSLAEVPLYSTSLVSGPLIGLDGRLP